MVRKPYNLLMKQSKAKIIGFAAYSGTGKTTLLKQLIPLLTQAGLRVAIIKHSHHNFNIDQPGKDSYELHKAGSSQTLLTSKYRSALITENQPLREPSLNEALKQLNLSAIELVLVEGFRHESDLPRIELHRPALGKPLLYPQAENIIAIASDEELKTDLPLININKPHEISTFILDWMG